MKTSPVTTFKQIMERLFSVLFMVCVLTISPLFAGLKTSTGSGNWNTAGTWNPTGVPTATDSVVIQSGHTITLNANGTCGALTVNGTLNYSANNNRTLTVTTAGSIHQGDVTINGTFAFANNNGQTLTLAGNFTCSGTFVNSTGNNGAIVFNGTGTKTIRSTATLKSVTVNNAGLTLMADGGLSLTTNLTVTAGSFNPNGNLITGSGTNTLTVTGTLVVDAPTFAENYLSWETRTLNTGSTVMYTNTSPTIDASLTYGNLTFSGTGTAGSSGNLTVRGNLVKAGNGNMNFGTYDVTISGSTASHTIAGFTTSGAFNCTKSAGTATVTDSVSVGSLVINGAGATLNLGSNLTHTVFGDVSILAGTLDAGSCTLNVEGTWTESGTFIANSGTVNLTGSGPPVVLPTSTFHNLKANRPNGVILTGDVTVNRTLTLSLGSFTIGANTLYINGDIVVTAGSLIGATTSNLIIGGSGASVTLPGVTLNNVTINRVSGVDLLGNLIVSGIVTLTNGTVRTADNLLILTASATIDNAGTGRVEGNVRKDFLGVETGIVRLMSTGSYLEIQSPGITSITVRSFPNTPILELPPTADTSRCVPLRYYQITNAAGTGTVKLRLDYLPSEMGSQYSVDTGSLWKKSLPGQPWFDLLAETAGTYFVEKTNLAVSDLTGFYAIAEPEVLGQSVFQIAPTGIAFGNVVVGSSKQDSVTVTNTGTSTLTISSVVSDNGEFSVTPTSGSIAPSGSMKFYIAFSPVNTGAESGNIVFVHDASGSPHTVAVSGTGVAPGFAVAPTSIAFGNVVVGSSKQDSVTVTNTGSSTLTISSVVSDNGEFGVTPTSGSIAPSGSMKFYIAFSPANTGAESGNIVFVHDASGSPHTVAVSGTGVAPGFAVAPTSIAFGNVVVGSSKQDSVTVTNTGTSTLTISSVASDNGEFSVTPTSGSIAPSGSMKFYIAFSPANTGAESGNIVFVHDASGSPHTVAVSGTGVAPLFAVRPTEIIFTQVPVGTSRSDSFWVYNRGNIDLIVSSVSSTDPRFSVTPNTATINAGDSLRFRVTFTPDSVRTYAGFVVIEHNGSTSPDTVRLSGDAITNVPGNGYNVPLVFELYQNYPNPFNPMTTITFSVDVKQYTHLAVYTIVGQHVATLFSDLAEPLKLYTITFDGTGLASGVYFYHLVSGSKITHRKMLLVK